MSEITFNEVQFTLPIPETLGGGIINESDYRITSGSKFLLQGLFGQEADDQNLGYGIVAEFSKPDSLEKALTVITDNEIGPLVMRKMYSTDELLGDSYDISEALRLSQPVADYADALLSLNRLLTEEQQNFMAKRSVLLVVDKAISTELDRPYRKDIDAQPAKVIDEDGTTVVKPEFTVDNQEDQIVRNVDTRDSSIVSAALRGYEGRTSAIEGMRSLVIRSSTGECTDIGANVQHFIDGVIPSIPAWQICLVDSAEGWDEVSRISASSEAGAIAAKVASRPSSQFAWNGRQTELSVPWHSVVSAGSMAQSK